MNDRSHYKVNLFLSQPESLGIDENFLLFSLIYIFYCTVRFTADTHRHICIHSLLCGGDSPTGMRSIDGSPTGMRSLMVLPPPSHRHAIIDALLSHDKFFNVFQKSESNAIRKGHLLYCQCRTLLFEWPGFAQRTLKLLFWLKGDAVYFCLTCNFSNRWASTM